MGRYVFLIFREYIRTYVHTVQKIPAAVAVGHAGRDRRGNDALAGAWWMVVPSHADAEDWPLLAASATWLCPCRILDLAGRIGYGVAFLGRRRRGPYVDIAPGILVHRADPMLSLNLLASSQTP